MKIVIHLSEPELHNQVIQALSVALLLDKVELNTEIDPCPEKLEQLHGLTNIRKCRIERGADNTFSCSSCGRTIPATSQGELDLERIGQQMSLRQW